MKTNVINFIRDCDEMNIYSNSLNSLNTKLNYVQGRRILKFMAESRKYLEIHLMEHMSIWAHRLTET